MRIASVNCSPSVYNLACAKIANYHRECGDQVYEGGWAPLVMDEMVTSQIDKFYFSVIFSWEIQELIRQVNMVRSWGKEVEIGGPAATFMANYIERRTGVAVHRGLDDRFERVPGDYELTFSSRGCPHKCRFCGVKRVEPVAVEYDDFPLAHRVGDNNLTATSWDHQKLVVERFKDFAGKLDFNSGFDIRFFEEKHYELYSQLKLESAPRGRHWRFAFDTMAVEKDVRRVAAMMRGHGLDRHQVMFYVLIGFPGQTPEECLYRLNTIIELGMNPYCLGKGTPIVSSTGMKKIEEIVVGDEVLGGDGYFHQVTDTMARPYVGDMIELQFKGINFPIVVTADHNILVDDGGEPCLKEAGALKKTDKLQLVIPKTQPNLEMPHYPSNHPNLKPIPKDITPEAMRLFGYYLAEGSLHKTSVRWMFNDSNKKPWAEDVVKIASSIGLNSHSMPYPHHGLEVAVSSRALIYAIDQLCGRKRDKFISAQLLQMSDDMLWELIKGYLRGDGSLSPSKGHWRVTYSSVSLSLAMGIFLILTRLGFSPKVSCLHGKGFRQLYQVQLGICDEVREVAEKVWGRSIEPWLSHNHRYERNQTGPLIHIKSLTRFSAAREVHNITVAGVHNYTAYGLLMENCMRFWPLNSLKRDYVAPGWTEDLLQRMTTYYQVPFLWMAGSWENFRLGKNVISIPAEQAALNMLSAGECA